jgi:diaminopropionate ammonia-lyase
MKREDLSIIKNKNFKKSKITTFFNHLDLKKVRNYHHSIGIKETPLFSLSCLAEKYNIENIYLKDESKRHSMNAFKILGSSYAMHCEIKKNAKLEKFCTATDGNHGKSVARMAREMGKKSIIFVPKDTVESRIVMIKEEGAKVIKTEKNYDQTVKIAKDYVSNFNQNLKYPICSLIQDTAWDGYDLIPFNIMKGYLTQIIEISDQIIDKKIDFVFLQSGVGSWAASLVAYIQKYWKYQPLIYSVEPFSANCVFKSIAYGDRLSVNDKGKTIMAGLNCGTVSKIAWPILKNGLAGSISINDNLVEVAMKVLAYPLGEDRPIISGESGASSLAAIIGLNKIFNTSKNINLSFSKKTNILIINTEGDTDKKNYNRITQS